MRKILSSAAACVIACVTLSVNAFAADSAKVIVTISDGKLVLASAAVSVNDIDGDGALTINDALYAAHEEYFSEGADGYASAQTDYGLSLSKLWGVENGGSYGYYVNNASAMSLADPVNEGDYIAAYVYTDLTNYSDAYCFFDQTDVTIEDGEAVDLTLKQVAFDENWNRVEKPLEGAKIVVDGVESTAKTDADGKVSVSFRKAGTYTVSAACDDMVIVPPACAVTVNEFVFDPNNVVIYEEEDNSSPDTGVADVAVFAGVALLAAGAIAVTRRRK